MASSVAVSAVRRVVSKVAATAPAASGILSVPVALV